MHGWQGRGPTSGLLRLPASFSHQKAEGCVLGRHQVPGNLTRIQHRKEVAEGLHGQGPSDVARRDWSMAGGSACRAPDAPCKLAARLTSNGSVQPAVRALMLSSVRLQVNRPPQAPAFIPDPMPPAGGLVGRPAQRGWGEVVAESTGDLWPPTQALPSTAHASAGLTNRRAAAPGGPAATSKP